MKSHYLILLLLFFVPEFTNAQKTYCNPVNLDYGYTPIPNFSTAGRHRATADPVIVLYKNDYYLFSTNQWGYWWSPDMLNWKFIPRKFLRPWHNVYDELCAPAIGVLGDTMIVMGSTYSTNFTVWMSTNPKENIWKPLVDSFALGGWDPSFFADDDGRLYMYNGSSNRYPLYGIELNRKSLEPYGTRKEMYFLESWRYGWQRFGENMDNTWLDPFIEGAEMTRHNGKYYLQYGAPGTEFSGYSDGVVVGKNPLGPFTAQPAPFSFKPGGFARGAGHGSTFADRWGNYWHVSTITIAVKNNFERRIGIWPAGFDKDDVMYCNQAFGDYPTYLPDGPASHLTGKFTGWMLLNYNKPVTVSSTYGGFGSNNAVDEDIKTYWCAASGNADEWIQTDLGSLSTVRAIQINYADQDAEYLGKQEGIYHQYRIMMSDDGKKWKMVVDKGQNKTDIPHDYIELSEPVRTRYLKLINIHIPSGKFALSGFRVFGNGQGQLPGEVKGFAVYRTEKDRRNAFIRWNITDDAYAYNIYTGTAPDKLYNCIMVYNSNEYWFRAMDSQSPYYFVIEAINENGTGARSQILKTE